MMKQRIATVIAGIAAVTLITGAAIADEHGQGMQHGKMMRGKQEMSGNKSMMNDMPMMQGRMQGRMMGGMMGGMMERQVVATDDGGVIIIVGNLLLKYDEDLELVKKTMIEIDGEDMQQMMQKMTKHRDMCREMRMEMTEDEDTAKEAQ